MLPEQDFPILLVWVVSTPVDGDETVTTVLPAQGMYATQYLERCAERLREELRGQATCKVIGTRNKQVLLINRNRQPDGTPTPNDGDWRTLLVNLLQPRYAMTANVVVERTRKLGELYFSTVLRFVFGEIGRLDLGDAAVARFINNLGDEASLLAIEIDESTEKPLELMVTLTTRNADTADIYATVRGIADYLGIRVPRTLTMPGIKIIVTLK
jgi:hypothetical protein